MIYFEIKMQQTMFTYRFQRLKHEERLNDINKRTRDDFRDSKTLIKVKPMYLEPKLKETKFY